MWQGGSTIWKHTRHSRNEEDIIKIIKMQKCIATTQTMATANTREKIEGDQGKGEGGSKKGRTEA